jgi:hypothetical protein
MDQQGWEVDELSMHFWWLVFGSPGRKHQTSGLVVTRQQLVQDPLAVSQESKEAKETTLPTTADCPSLSPAYSLSPHFEVGHEMVEANQTSRPGSQIEECVDCWINFEQTQTKAGKTDKTCSMLRLPDCQISGTPSLPFLRGCEILLSHAFCCSGRVYTEMP